MARKKKTWPHLDFRFTSTGEFVNQDWSEPRNALMAAMFQAKWKQDARDFIKFWLEAIEYDDPLQEGEHSGP